MRSWQCAAFVFVTITTATATAIAQGAEPPAPPAGPAAPAIPAVPAMPPTDSMVPPEPGGMAAMPAEEPAPAEKQQTKEPKRGDFDAGGQVRLPSGPDEMGQYATFNWVAFDLKGQYYLLDMIKLTGNAPLAVIRPDRFGAVGGMGGVEPKMLGGMQVGMEVKLPKGPFTPKMFQSEIGLLLAGSYMREGALLLSEKDFPLFVGDLQPGFTGGLIAKAKLSSVLAFSMTPVWVYQSGTVESLEAVQIPMALIVKAGETVKLSADLGVYAGNDYSFRGKHGGRVSAGGALTMKVGPILAHAGAGVASVLTGPMYPTIKDSFYIDLNVKYAR